MITKFRIHLTYILCVIFFLIQEIVSIEDTTNQENSNPDDDKIKCGVTCSITMASVGALIVGVSVFAIFRHQKKRLRQKTGDLEEIVTVKYANSSFETINTQPVFQNTQAAQDHAKAT
ncbi:hypothetical protein RclHR1_02420005 [Rhizophagus clarus]|uniref:Uncharacterized protein n=1 Tax=Rhizophagus clarus TaxID=94130 RepID=A0A2Z6RRY3_9GLOM|nr:hypothetical protein RclHR1_02420005 [Rhizophagus clarus]